MKLPLHVRPAYSENEYYVDILDTEGVSVAEELMPEDAEYIVAAVNSYGVPSVEDIKMLLAHDLMKEALEAIVQDSDDSRSTAARALERIK